MKQRAKALYDFQHDPPTTIFLLSMRAGAVGINLTQANHVFLMEPCLNRALELQAIGRVHRLGQKSKVQVTRFVVEDTVEARLVRVLEAKYGKSSTYGTCEKPLGSQTSDKVDMMKEEFDLLFGVSSMSDVVHDSQGCDPDNVGSGYI